MLGLAVLFAIGIYLAFSVLVVWLAARWAKKHNRKPWVRGGLAAFLMYNLVFWDWIPTVVMHKYYCSTEAGFWVYKTPEQWAKENPGVLEMLKPWPASRIYGDEKVEFEFEGGTVTQYNDRFGYWHQRDPNLSGLMIDRYGWGIVDNEKKHFLVKSIDFSAGPHGAGVVWKSWLNRDACNDDRAVKNAQISREFSKQLQIKE